jgi:hypothetical protein
LWHIDPFLGNDSETNNKTTPVAKQQILKKKQLSYNYRGTVGNGVFYSVPAKGGEDQQQLQTTGPSSHQRGCCIRIMTARVQLENKITGRESQGACRQDELIGGKLPVVK